MTTTSQQRAEIIALLQEKIISDTLNPRLERITFSNTAIHVYTPNGWFELKVRKMKDGEMIWLGPPAPSEIEKAAQRER